MLNDNQQHVMRGQTVYTEEQVRRKVARALEDSKLKKEVTMPSKREMYVMVLEQLGITELNAPSTPSSRWLVDGEPDTFPKLINEERGDLMLGDHTDDELANAIFMYGNPCDREKTRRLMNGELTDMAYLTAGKERIRWLSRHLEASLKANQELVAEIQRLKQAIETLGNDDEPL